MVRLGVSYLVAPRARLRDMDSVQFDAEGKGTPQLVPGKLPGLPEKPESDNTLLILRIEIDTRCSSIKINLL